MGLSDNEYSTLVEYRKDILQIRQEQSSTFDKHILALATGAIGVSFIFLDNLADKTLLGGSYLYASWIALLLCILSTLFSFLSSRAACDQIIKQIDIDIAADNSPDFTKYKKTWSSAVTSLNVFSSIVFVVGLILLCIFIYKNL